MLRPYHIHHSLSTCLLLSFMLAVQPIAAELRTKGPPSVPIPVKNARAIGHAGLLQAPLNLWCQGVDPKSMEVVPVTEVIFRHDGQKHSATVSPDGLNATFVKDPANVADAGIWTCSIRTRSHGSATGDISVFLRPVVVSNSSNLSLRIDEKETNKAKHHPSTSVHTFEASGITVISGEDALMECPIHGFPRPQIQWKNENGAPLDQPRVTVSNGILTIRNVTDSDGGVYVCYASNSFSIRNHPQHNSVIVERRLRVKSEYAWLLPLTIIVITVALLVLIIVLCEFRKRRNEQKLLMPEEE